MYEKRKPADRSLFFIFVLSWIIVFVALIIVANGSDSSYRVRLEKNAVARLRAYGETQLAYQNANNDHYYGSWNTLVDSSYIVPEYHPGNIAEGYSLWVQVYNPIYYSEPRVAVCGYIPRHFTVVAFPRRTSPTGLLSTFSIREDQVVRTYDPDFDGCRAWDEDGNRGTMTWPEVEEDKVSK